jgi:hypothetical protein
MAGRGYESSYGKRLYFGAGTTRFVELQVLWPNQTSEWFSIETHSQTPKSATNHLQITLIEGTGRSSR